MKRYIGITVMVLTLVLLEGCKIISVTPDPGTTVIMNAGEKKIFTVKSIGGPLIQNDLEIDDWFYDRKEGSIAVFTYQPNDDDAGLHKALITVQDYWVEQQINMTIKHILWTDQREWSVLVQGIKLTPSTQFMLPGLEIKATAYPEGAYTYTWYLDGTAVHTGETFTPTTSQAGTHTLEVKAVGPITLTRSLAVNIACAGVTSSQTLEAKSIRPTMDGGYIVSGYEYNGITSYSLAVKFNAQGAVQWEKSLGHGTAYGAFETTDGGILIAGTAYYEEPYDPQHGSSDFYLVKLDSLGTIVWQHTYGGCGWERAWTMQPTGDGGAILAGGSGSTDIAGFEHSGGIHGYVVKLNAMGIVQWQWMNLNWSEYDYVRSIAQTADGGYLLACTTNGDANECLQKLDAAGHWQWMRSEHVKAVVSTPDGGTMLSKYDNHYYLQKLDPQDNPIWEQPLEGMDFPHVLPLTDGGYFLASGVYAYLDDPNIGYVDTAGNLVWTKKVLLDEISDITQTNDGTVVAASSVYNIGIGLFELYKTGN